MGDETLTDRIEQIEDELSEIKDELEQDCQESDTTFGPDKIIKEYIDGHPNLTEYWRTRSEYPDGNEYYVRYNFDVETPGRGAIGNNRTEIEKRLQKQYGCTIDIEMMEPASPSNNYDMVAAVSITED